MCIIIYSKGALIPEEHLENSEISNPHGIGLMWKENGVVKIEKGIDLSYLIDKLKKLKGVEHAVHFRLATHGEISAEMCHPFVVSSNIKELLKTKTETDIALMHNGTIPGFGAETHLSDTAEFVATVVAKYRRDLLHKTSGVNALLKILDLTRDKFLIFTPKTTLVSGKGWIERNGILYSNSSFEYNFKKFYKTRYEYFNYCDMCGRYTTVNYITKYDIFVCKNCEKDLLKKGAEK